MAATWRNAWWLAGREARRAWAGYLLTAGATLLIGLFASVLAEIAYVDRPRANPRLNNYLVDMMFLLILANLGQPWLGGDYYQVWRDPFSQRLAFLRALPIPLRELVLSRVLRLVATLVLLAPLFFLPLYRFSEDLRARIDPSHFLTFAAIWCGWGLLMGGLGLYLEWATSGKALFAAQLVWSLALALLPVAPALAGRRIVRGTVEAAQAYGAFAATLALLAGAAGLALAGWATGRRLARRDLAA